MFLPLFFFLNESQKFKFLSLLTRCRGKKMAVRQFYSHCALYAIRVAASAASAHFAFSRVIWRAPHAICIHVGRECASVAAIHLARLCEWQGGEWRRRRLRVRGLQAEGKPSARRANTTYLYKLELVMQQQWVGPLVGQLVSYFPAAPADGSNVSISFCSAKFQSAQSTGVTSSCCRFFIKNPKGLYLLPSPWLAAWFNPSLPSDFISKILKDCIQGFWSIDFCLAVMRTGSCSSELPQEDKRNRKWLQTHCC